MEWESARSLIDRQKPETQGFFGIELEKLVYNLILLVIT